MTNRNPILLALSLTCACLAVGCDSETDESYDELRNGNTVEIFKYAAPGDVIANTADPNSAILAPWPAGIVPLGEPEIIDGVLIAAKIYHANDQLIGFGTEQEVVNFATALSQSTYTLTLPGRGTLMLAQVEDFTPLFAELFDMIANQESIRDYDPPFSVITTMPGTGRIVGGTGEFEHARGTWTELNDVHQFNLGDRTFTIDAVLEVTFKPGDGIDD
jgi:hypothetical protein